MEKLLLTLCVETSFFRLHKLLGAQVLLCLVPLDPSLAPLLAAEEDLLENRHNDQLDKEGV